MGAHTPGEYLVVRQKSLLQKHTESPPEAYDVIVVLGAAVWPGGQPSPTLQRRTLHAVDLLQRGYATYLLVTGGLVQPGGNNIPFRHSEVCVHMSI
jgi:vancomycin permeability regulator SanA